MKPHNPTPHQGWFTNRFAMRKLLTPYLLIFLFQTNIIAQKTLFSSDFNVSQGSSYTTSGSIGTSGWTVARSGADFGARIHNGILELTNNATAASEANGWAFAYINTSTSYQNPFNAILDQNKANIQWFFNLRQSHPNPSGFSTASLSYGTACAYVLACTSPNVNNTGTGYALYFGQTGDHDFMYLVRFTNGLQGTLTPIFEFANSGAPDFGDEYFSFKCAFETDLNKFDCKTALDGKTSFLNPTRSDFKNYGGNSGPAGTETSLLMPYSGVYFQARGNQTNTTFFDNFSVILKPTDPSFASLTYNQNFGTNAFSATPASFQVWGGVPGNSTSNLSQAESNLPFIDVDLTSQFGGFTSEPVGGAYGVGGGIDARLGIATSSDAEKGLCQPVLGLSVDSGITRLKVIYDQIVLYSGQRTCGNALQYNQYGTNTWTTIPESVLNLGAYPTLSLRNKKSLLVNIPNQKAAYKFRWISWRNNGSGSSNTTLGLDNVLVTAPTNDKFLEMTGTPPAASSRVAGTTNVVLQRINVTCPSFSAAALINALSIDTKGSYQTSDLNNLKVYFSTDNVWDAGDLLLATKTTGIGPGYHYIIFSSTPTINPGTTGYVFLTADISVGAQVGRTIYSDVVYQLSVGSNAEILGSYPLTAGGVQTIVSPPLLVTPPTVSALGFGAVTLQGNVLSTNFSDITERGFYYSTINGFADGAGTKVSTTSTFGTGSFSEIVSSLPNGTTYYFKSFATNAAGTTYSAQATFSTPKPAPANSATALACGTTSATFIPLTWTDAIGSPAPDGYLISWSTTSFGAISNPINGIPVANNSFNLNVAQGVQSANISNLTFNTTYYFRIFSYTNSGSNILYRTLSPGQTSCATLSGAIENFEAGSKTTLTNENINCTLGSWNFNNALLGTSASDLKAGLQSARISSGGSVTMNFDLFSGSSSVSVKNGRFVGQPGSNFNIDYSTNQGGSWTNVGNLNNNSSLATNNLTIGLTSPARFRMVHSGGSGTFNADDFTIVPFCSAPEPTSSVTVSNLGAIGCDIAWGSAAGNGTMLVLRPFSSSNALPILNTSYTPNLNWTLIGPAGQIDVNNRVFFRGTGSSVSGITGLTSESRYTATAYNYNTTLNCYQLENPASSTFWTYSLEPGAHAASFSASVLNEDQINLSFSAANTISNADGYLVLVKTGLAPTGTPTDGVAYVVGDVIGDANVAAWVNSTSATTFSINGLDPETQYFFSLIPYNWNGSEAATYNYRTAATIPQANATTTAIPSVLSDILIDPNFSYSSNIPIISLQSNNANTVGNTVAVLKIIVRDGGGSEDEDNFPTILNTLNIKFGPGSTIRSAGLFGGSNQNTYITHVSAGQVDIIFNNLQAFGALVTAPDGGSVELTLRVTFKSTITDNSQLAFSIEGADVSAFATSSSQFFNFPKETSSLYQDRNRLEVTATTIDYGIQPQTRESGVALRIFTIQAEDALGNVDLDQNSCQVALTLNSGTGSMSAPGSPYTFSGGIISVNDVSFSATGSKTILASAQSCLGNATDVSSSFSITSVSFVTNDYRSVGTVWGTLANWQRFNGFSWVAASVLPPLSSRVYIQTAMSVNVAANVNEIIISPGASLTVNTEITCNNLIHVKTGGALNLNANIITQSTTDFIVEPSAGLVINYAANNQSSLWNGVENFQHGSNATIRNWGVSASPTSSRVLVNGTSISKNSANAFFGNLFVDLTSNLGNTFFLFDGSKIGDFTSGNLTVKSTNSAQRISLCSSGGGDNMTIKGNLVVDALYATAGNFQFGQSGSNQVTIEGNLNLDGGNTLLKSASSSGADTINVFGNLSMAASTNLLFNELASGSTLVFLKVKGDVSVNASANIRNGSATSGVGNYKLIFNGSGDGSSASKTQEVSIASTSTTLENVNVRFECDPGSYVKLINQDLQLGQNSEVYLENNSTFDFGFSPTNVPLLVSSSGSATGTRFTVFNNATLKITSEDGVRNGGGTGNVRTDSKSFGNNLTFWFAGKSNQTTGNAILGFSKIKNIICDLESGGLTLTPSGNINIPYRSFVEIRQGKLVENASGLISGEGHLVMLGGTFGSTVANGIHPNLSDFDRFSIGSGTFELAATGNQTLNFLPSSFASLVISGSGTKTLSESILLTNNLTISNGTLSPGAFDITGNANLNMTGGKLRYIKTGNTPLPDLNGFYSLTGGTIELDGTNGESSQTLRSLDAGANPINYFNLNLKSSEGNYVTHNIETVGDITVSGTCRVFSPTVLFLDVAKKIDGTGAFVLDSAATIKITNSQGITTNACGTGGTCGQIITSSRTFSPGASYWYYGNEADAITGNGLPSTVENLIINRKGSDIALSQNTTIRNEIKASEIGMLTTGLFKVVLADTATISEQDLAHVRGLVETTRNLNLAAHDFGGLGLEIDADGNVPGLTHVKRLTDISVSNGINEGIRQKFIILPTVNSGLNAELRFHYFESEINGLDENYFLLYRSTDDGSTWVEQPGALLYPDENYVSKSGIAAFSEWTLGDINNPLPLTLLSFEGRVEKGKGFLQWKAIHDESVKGFHVLRSADGFNFKSIGYVHATQKGNDAVNYSFVDADFSRSCFYKLQYDEPANEPQLSHLVYLDCRCEDQLDITLFPNPTDGKITFFSNQMVEEKKVFRAKLFAIDGKLVAELLGGLVLVRQALEQQLVNSKPGVFLLELHNQRFNKKYRISKY